MSLLNALWKHRTLSVLLGMVLVESVGPASAEWTASLYLSGCVNVHAQKFGRSIMLRLCMRYELFWSNEVTVTERTRRSISWLLLLFRGPVNELRNLL